MRRGVYLPWSGERGEAAVTSAGLSLPGWLQESAHAPCETSVSASQHPCLPSGSLSRRAGSCPPRRARTGCPVYGLACLLPVCRLWAFPSFQMPPLWVEVSTLCLFVHPTSLCGTFPCSFGCKGVVRSVSGWLSCWENCSTWRCIFDVIDVLGEVNSTSSSPPYGNDPQPALLLTVFRIKSTPYYYHHIII